MALGLGPKSSESLCSVLFPQPAASHGLLPASSHLLSLLVVWSLVTLPHVHPGPCHCVWVKWSSSSLKGSISWVQAVPTVSLSQEGRFHKHYLSLCSSFSTQDSPHSQPIQITSLFCILLRSTFPLKPLTKCAARTKCLFEVICHSENSSGMWSLYNSWMTLFIPLEFVSPFQVSSFLIKSV